MKKFTFIAVALALVVAFTSCNKEGKYTPSKKIDRIYTEGSSSSKTLSQVWNWDGNKLQSIDYYYSGSISYTDNFTYKNGHITRIDDYKNSEYTEYTYDGSKLNRATRYYKGQLREEYTFTYKNGKIGTIIYNYYSSSKGMGNLNKESNPLKYIFPELSDKVLTKISEKQAGCKGSYTANISLEWDGNNISMYRMTSGSYTDEVKFQYDNKKNPFYGLLDMYMDESIGYFSKNNITSETYTEYYNGDTDVETSTYQYTYDGNYPTVKRSFEEGTYYRTYYIEYK